jgi:hypothetical protein
MIPAPFAELDPHAYAVLALVVAIFGVGRLARIITYDEFPPAVWWRVKWSGWTKDGPWTKLFTCYWCLSPWIMAVAIGWYWIGAYVVVLSWLWWIFWGWLALSYVAAIVVNHDERE